MPESAVPRARYAESERHESLKRLAAEWALAQGLSFVAPEVSFPHRRFRVDVAACAPARKTPSRERKMSLTSVLKAAVVFECKQSRGDLVRDNKRRHVLVARLRTLESRRVRLEQLLGLHLPHLSLGESLFPEFDSYRLRDHAHGGYHRLMREIRISKRGVVEGTKFDRLLAYRLANLHYLVSDEDLVAEHELPEGWGLLLRRDGKLELLRKPLWREIGVEEQLIFLQRIAARKCFATARAPQPADSVVAGLSPAHAG